MRSRRYNLLAALGFVLVTTMMISAALDIRRTLPHFLPVTGEVRNAEAAGLTPAHPKLVRSFLAKDHVQPGTGAGSGGTFRSAASPPGSSANPGLLDDAAAQAGMGISHGDEPFLPAKTPEPEIPDIPSRLVIPAIDLDAPILPAKTTLQKIGGKEYQQWEAPKKFAAGWHEDSAMLGQPGNTVLNGHHNINGKVFERLVDLNPGDLIVIFGTHKAFIYQITNKMLLPEKYQELDVRMDNARWILPSDDERLTLVTCWPEESNTHRLVIVARRLGGQ